MILGLESLPRMISLEVNKNLLNEINHLLTIPPLHTQNMRSLNVSNNFIQNLEEVVRVVVGFSNLESFDLYGNPAAEDETYKFRICENSNIKEIDGSVINPVLKEGFSVNNF